MFRTPARIALIRRHAYTRHASLFSKDVIISPEKLVRNAIERLIAYPGAVQVQVLADGKAWRALVAVVVRGGCLL